jgi:carboxymethylenebutenolidase
MGETISLTTSDGHTLDAYKATPSGAVKGGLVVIQEIFGINGQIRRTVDHFAEQGYVTIAPALFDRVEKGIELGYNETDFGIGRETRGKITDEWIIADVGAAVQDVASAGKVSVIGFCFGGYATYVAACAVDGVSAAMPFYGGGIAAKVGDMQPKCPTQFHFGDKDAAIPLDDLQKIKDALQDSPMYVYDDAGHGFTCDDRDSFNPGATDRSFARALAWMDEHAA